MPPDLQGRVFSIRRLIAWFVNPLSQLIAGPLADFVLEPAMRQETFLSNALGWLVGVGPGRGMALMFVVCGLAATVVGVGGYAFRLLRDVEILMPDHDQLPLAEPVGERHARLQALLEERQRLLSTPTTGANQEALWRVSQQLRQLGQQRSAVAD
ncbi:MAG: hypothetical protein JW726_16660 [Anaerolineales bacterium]|nr:hypothetical protein [Anaerolineales bacterium]